MDKRKIIICSNRQKMRLLKKSEKEASFCSVKYLTKNELYHKLFFTYHEEVFFYLRRKYHWNFSVIETYLDSLYFIEEDREYHHPNLIFLQELKKELVKENLLIFSSSFNNSSFEISHCYDLDKIVEDKLSLSINIPDVSFSKDVYEYSTMEEEVVGVCLHIIELVKKGISLDKIYLCNVSEDYYYTLKRIFSYFHIPINIPFQNSIYSSYVVQEYLKSKEVVEDESEASKLLKNMIQKYSIYDLEDPVVFEYFTYQLKNTYFSNPKYSPAVSCANFYEEDFLDDDYVFVLGMRQDSFPKTFQDNNYFNDSMREEVGCYRTKEWNERYRKLTIYSLSCIKNLFLSYSLKTPFQSYYPSSLIGDFNLNVIHDSSNFYQYSNLYNQFYLGRMLDDYLLYGHKNDQLEEFFSTYKIPYRTYSNQFKGISKDLYWEKLPYPLKLSYTSINSYIECGFKYYIQYVLKLDSYEDLFSSYVGSLYHKILSLYQKEHFDFEKEYQSYLEKRDLSLKEVLFLYRIKKDLLELIEVLKKQKELTGFTSELWEQKVEIPLQKEVSVELVGYIDKILYYKNIEDVYFSIVDYKTGNIDTHIEPMKYGLHMQLPVYLYFIHYGRVFSNPIFTGMYYQNILFSYPTWSDKLEQTKEERYYLQGYSTDNTNILEKFDSTYQESRLIKSMKYSSDKGFGTYSKVLSDDEVYSMVEMTKNTIDQKVDSILEADFKIQPKVYNGENISCRYCRFHDLCYTSEKDIVYYDKVDDLSFLGGEE